MRLNELSIHIPIVLLLLTACYSPMQPSKVVCNPRDPSLLQTKEQAKLENIPFRLPDLAQNSTSISSLSLVKLDQLQSDRLATGSIGEIEFSDDGQSLAVSASQDFPLQPTAFILVQENSNTNSVKLRSATDSITLAWLTDNQLALALGRDIEFWNTATFTLICSSQLASDSIREMVYSKQSGLLAVASDDKNVRLIRGGDGTLVETLRHERPPNTIALSPNGDRVYVATADRQHMMWEIEDGKKLWQSPAHNPIITSAQFAPQGDSLVTVGDRIKFIDPLTGKVQKELQDTFPPPALNCQCHVIKY